MEELDEHYDLHWTEIMEQYNLHQLADARYNEGLIEQYRGLFLKLKEMHQQLVAQTGLNAILRGKLRESQAVVRELRSDSKEEEDGANPRKRRAQGEESKSSDNKEDEAEEIIDID